MGASFARSRFKGRLTEVASFAPAFSLLTLFAGCYANHRDLFELSPVLIREVIAL